MVLGMSMSQSRPRTRSGKLTEMKGKYSNVYKKNSVSFIKSPTLAVNNVNKDVHDDNGACPADACTAGTTEGNHIQLHLHSISVNVKVKNRCTFI